MGETDKYGEERNGRGFTRDEAVLRFPALKEPMLLSSCRKSSQSASVAPEPNQSASFQLRRKPTKETAGNSFRKKPQKKMKEKHRKWVQNPAAAKGISMGGAAAVAEVLSEQGGVFTFKTRRKKERHPRLFLGVPHFCSSRSRQGLAGVLHARGGALQLAVAGGWCLMWRLAAG